MKLGTKNTFQYIIYTNYNAKIFNERNNFKWTRGPLEEDNAHLCGDMNRNFYGSMSNSITPDMRWSLINFGSFPSSKSWDDAWENYFEVKILTGKKTYCKPMFVFVGARLNMAMKI